MLKRAKRGAIAPFIAMDVLRAANQRQANGADVLHLEVGEPAAGAPAPVLEAAQAALATPGRLGYTEALGIPPLRAAIARHYRAQYGLDVAAEQVVVTTGASGAFLLSFLAAFDAGDRVALAYPCYPAYRNILQALDIEVVGLMAGPEERFQPSVALLEKAGPLNGLVVASPSNPTGTMLDAQSLADLSRWCAGAGVRLVSDEIYHGITYSRAAQSALASNRDAVIVNSFSKYFAMTGWRLGWMVVPPDLAQPVERLAQNLFISPPTLPQHAALKAFDCTETLQGYVQTYAANRALLLERLPEAGFDRLAPADGAFYLYADVSEMCDDSRAFCRRILEEIDVALTPGVDFDPFRGDQFIRISFAGRPDVISAAADRLVAWRRRAIGADRAKASA